MGQMKGKYPAKSGCKIGISKKTGKQYISAWKKTKSAFFSIIASRREKTKEGKETAIFKTDTGKIWESWSISILNKSTLDKKIYNGLFDQVSQKLIIKELGWVLNPKAPNGGYVGSFKK